MLVSKVNAKRRFVVFDLYCDTCRHCILVAQLLVSFYFLCRVISEIRISWFVIRFV